MRATTPARPVTPAAYPRRMAHHVVWDWNGTLLADQGAVLDALNALMVEYGLPPTDMDTYRRLYTRPVRRFYERLLDKPIEDAEWHWIDDHFHTSYAAALEKVHLDLHAHDALDRVASTGRSQSLLSMARHDDLVRLVTAYGIHDRFLRVDGVRGPGGDRKARYLEAHLRALALDEHIAPSKILVVGDAVDDAHAAMHVGAHCILYDGGSHPVEELESTGLQVARTLTEALELAGVD